jgi:hypothetical protein
MQRPGQATPPQNRVIFTRPILVACSPRLISSAADPDTTMTIKNTSSNFSKTYQT